MPQMLVPFFAPGATNITLELAYKREDGKIVYFNANMPIFAHAEDDNRTFRMVTSQLCIYNNVRPRDIIKAFGVTKSSVDRALRTYREEGPAGFYKPRRTRGAAVLVPEVLEKAQALLNEGVEVSEIAERLSLKKDTLRKAITAGRLHKIKKKELNKIISAQTKSERNKQDSQAVMGMGATNELARVAASLGGLTAVEPSFQAAMDVPNGGVLFAVSALLVNGLLRHAQKYFELPNGYYGLESIFLLLAFMALARFKNIEALRYYAPGEWGNLLGLDRVPEVRTLREKIKQLTTGHAPEQWSAELCQDWMKMNAAAASMLYIDGHVRVYNGKKTKLPRHYTSRQKLCLRATVDYWVNAMGGLPFFYVNQAVDPGLLKVLEHDIVPRLETDIPEQPSKECLEANPQLHRFMMLFDREGYSPDFMKKMWKKRIACATYNKYPGEDWRESEFKSRQVTFTSGQTVELKLAERGTFLSEKLWVREIRKLTKRGHQTSIISTGYMFQIAPLAAAMFDRWCQENFFKYMRTHYNIDRLVDYNLEEIPDATKVINPEHRQFDAQVRSKKSMLTRQLSEFGALNLEENIEPDKVEKFIREKAQLQETISDLQNDVDALKEKRKAVKKHIPISELPESEQFDQLSTQSKHFIDTIKMIAYRGESAMVQILREKMVKKDEGRSLLRAIYNTEADIIPNEEMKTLTIRLHCLANHSSDSAIQYLCQELNETETCFPGTNLRLVYEMI